MPPKSSTSSGPPSKKPKVETDRQTRAQSSAAPPPPPPVARYDSDDNMDGDESEFEYDSDVEEPQQGDDDAIVIDEDDLVDAASQDGDDRDTSAQDGLGRREVETITISDESDLDEPPPEPVSRPKGKLTSRKQYTAHIEALVARYGAHDGEQVTDLRRDDEQLTFSLVHPAFPNGLKLILDTPDLGGYPLTHQVVCYADSEIGADVQAVLEEIADLPERLDRSLPGLIEYLVSRLILGQPAPFTASQASNAIDEDEDDSDADDHLFGIGGADMGQSTAFMDALRSDFKGILAAGFRPGYTRISELDNIVSVSKKVNTLGVPLRALQAWDSELLTGEVRYLVLLMNFGSKYPDPDNGTRGDVKFRVGISPKYKPSKEAVAGAFRSHSANTYTKNDFEAISLSKPFDSLFMDKFQEILLTRRSNSKVGWAAAEHHCLEPGNTKEAIDTKACRAADAEEKKASGTYILPDDPMKSNTEAANNYPLLAYSYLIRRFVMCPRFCLICFKKINSGIVALKPFVCESQLCLFQLISLGLGPSLEHEIQTNTPAVDLLVQLAYTAAKEQRLTATMQPQGLSLEVPKNPLIPWKVGDETVEFDGLDVVGRNNGIAALVMELPPIPEMQVWLNGDDLSEVDKSLSRNRKLQEMRSGNVSHSAWKLLRWIVASNTSYLKLIEEEDELVQGVPKAYRQFRLVVGSPAKEHLLESSISAIQAGTGHAAVNARAFPTLYAFHGSAVKNWHSILREGLHFNETINGRAYGHGVYFAKQGEISLGTYAQFASTAWKGADFGVGRIAAICEIVNKPDQFISTSPYFVVDKVDWIQCRYLIVQRGASYNYTPAAETASDDATTAGAGLTRSIPLDPAHPLTLSTKAVGIPDLHPKLEALNKKLVDKNEDLHASDEEVLKEREITVFETPKLKSKKALGPNSSRAEQRTEELRKLKDTFVPVGPELLKLIRVLPPPKNPNKGAVRQITTEMRAMLAEQEKDGPTVCGYYLDPERSNDNVFTWIVELTGFDPDLPLSKDMKAHGVTSLLLEVRFPESFSMSPPFFRVVYPRFLPFLQGGGGHVTAGGSLCMDLLTSSGWSPAYSIPAVLLQIKMAMHVASNDSRSSTEPRPARLDPNNWKLPYSMNEAIAGFERAALAHNWVVPPEFKELTRSF